MRRILITGLAMLMLFAMAVPASAHGKHKHKYTHHTQGKDIVDIVLAVSGTSGFDRNPRDYDLLREALVATDLVDDVKAAKHITVFAPKDRAFKRLARDLGWRGRGERSAFGFIARNVPSALLTDVLLYHVAPRKLTKGQIVSKARRHKTIPTLLGPTIRPKKHWRSVVLIDKEPDLRNPRIVKPRDIRAKNGIIHTINRVLIPADL